MLRRLLGLSLGVAALAVSATALLATYGTGDRLREGLAEDESLLATDSDILAALYTHANEHRDWTAVEPLVRALAERTGRRIALTTPDGEPIADSARGTALPPTAAALIDAAALSASDIRMEPNVVARDPAARVVFGFYVWQLSEQERGQRQALAEEALDCARRIGSGNGTPERQRVYSSDGGGTPPALPCVPAAVFEPSAAGRRLAAQAAEGAAACLAEHRLSTEECRERALAEAKRSYVAAPADLYLGASDRFDPLSPDGWWRTAVTVAAVLLAAAAVTVLAGRRLVRPIRALTAAAGRMTEGDHDARVPVRGNDEVTRLAAAFNTMADSIASTDRQRKALVGDVAHELRTPLANVRSHLEAAQDGVVPLDLVLVRSLIEESALLERLVADLQDLALADAGMLRIHPEERDAADLAEQAVAAHRARAEASEVDLAVDPARLTVFADPARLRQALGNLVSNAIRHTPPGGAVTVSVTGTAQEALFTVADTGSGIAAEHLPHIFDRFYRADPSRSRTTGGGGLGLAITKHLVEAHGGHLEVTSTAGEGSTFTIRLPRTAAMP